MRQAFRRASGRIRAIDPSPAPKTVVDRWPLVAANNKINISSTTAQHNNQDSLDSDGVPRVNSENVFEEHDPQYDVMLSQMVGRIRSKPGGKPEIGEAAAVERYNRPLPKLRNAKPDSGRYEERLTTPGTLNVAQPRHIMLLHQGKTDDHNGPMDFHQIAKKFCLETAQVQRILQYLSLPPEDNNKQKSLQ